MTPNIVLRLFAILLGSMLSLHAFAAVNDAGIKVKWSYVGTTGPSHWGMLDPAFEQCDIGKLQTPINIGREKVRADYALTVNYQLSPMYIGDDLHTKLDIGQSRTIVDTGHGLQLNFHGKPRESISYAGKDYELVQFHFHSPSETLWHKQSYPLEIHFVHQGKNGAVAVVAVFVKGGDDNAALEEIIAHLPADEGREYTVSDGDINPADLLPSDKRYYSFMGSLTAPPCNEGLQWIVMPKPITASPAQILKIREVSGGSNARPVQPLNGRTLNYSVQ